jgi:hypothetical protein
VLSRCDEGITDSAAGIRFDKLGLVGGRADPDTTA